uniref:Uncharacterized protein n=1 Tax=Panagrellus redivivus TaxID=6233 RepID=A0A7E4ZXX2_PANRE
MCVHLRESAVVLGKASGKCIPVPEFARYTGQGLRQAIAPNRVCVCLPEFVRRSEQVLFADAWCYGTYNGVMESLVVLSNFNCCHGIFGGVMESVSVSWNLYRCYGIYGGVMNV